MGLARRANTEKYQDTVKEVGEAMRAMNEALSSEVAQMKSAVPYEIAKVIDLEEIRGYKGMHSAKNSSS